jgi:AmmeMemoRadiSam system protein A
VLSHDERKGLLLHARRNIEAHLRLGSPPVPPRLSEPHGHAGAFVTLEVARDLRGCIGHPGSRERLDEVVAECAVAAASEDPRFPPITPNELEGMEVEISVLTPIEPISAPDQIEIGRDGLVVEEGRRRGLLLPQVAVEHGWDRETFLAHTCIKAGLNRDAWRRGAKVLRFQAEVFSERDYREEATEKN